MTAAAEPVLADRAPIPPVRLTASTIDDDALDALYAERDRLAAVLREVLAEFGPMRDTYGGPVAYYDGSADITPATFERWRAALDGPSEPRTAPPAALESHTGPNGAPGAAGGPWVSAVRRAARNHRKAGH